MKKNKLTCAERQLIARYRRMKMGVRDIARQLDRAPSTATRELKRNSLAYQTHDDSFAQGRAANELADASRAAAAKKKMRLKSYEIRHYVELHLREAHWTPQAIAGCLTRLGYNLSSQAIYDFIDDENRSDLNACLPIRGRSRRRRSPGRKRQGPRPLPAAPKRSIETRPAEISLRATTGDFELDALLGKRGGAALQVLVDRAARKVFLKKVSSLSSEVYRQALRVQFEEKIPASRRRSITMDNGAEHALHAQFDHDLGVVSYFCHPYCSSERGTVENRNKLLRRFFPKGEEIENYSDKFIQWVEDYVNSMPMSVLGFRTPDAVWNDPSFMRKAA